MVWDFTAAFVDQSTVKRFAVGIDIGSMSFVAVQGGSRITDNYGTGGVAVWGDHSALGVSDAFIEGNGEAWGGTGILVKRGGHPSVYGGGVISGNSGGVLLSGKGMLYLEAGSKVAGNGSYGVAARNDSMVSGPSLGPSGNAIVEGNSDPNRNWYDLTCDESSMIIGADRITGTDQNRSCTNIKAGE